MCAINCARFASGKLNPLIASVAVPIAALWVRLPDSSPAAKPGSSRNASATKTETASATRHMHIDNTTGFTPLRFKASAAAKDWLADRVPDLLPVPYYHMVFTLPAAIADIAYQNKPVVYDLLFKGLGRDPC
jgi:hypothetical protein